MFLEESDTYITSFNHAALEIQRAIEACLFRAGIMCRVFSRGKSSSSLTKKLQTLEEDGSQKYHLNGKKIQDAIGIRVVLYFSDDISIVRDLISRNFKINDKDSIVDSPKGEYFSVTRYNLIYELPDTLGKSISSEIGSDAIDKTFEVQLRTILSEGWHEVEHDLRYKNKNYWTGYDELTRSLNGIVATLETSEWSMRKIFDELCYNHYKSKNWNAMLTLKLRTRLDKSISLNLTKILDSKVDVAKLFYRLDRAIIIKIFEECRILATLDNAIYIWNYISVKHDEVSDITPNLIKDKIKSSSYFNATD